MTEFLALVFLYTLDAILFVVLWYLNTVFARWLWKRRNQVTANAIREWKRGKGVQ